MVEVLCIASPPFCLTKTTSSSGIERGHGVKSGAAVQRRPTHTVAKMSPAVRLIAEVKMAGIRRHVLDFLSSPLAIMDCSVAHW